MKKEKIAAKIEQEKKFIKMNEHAIKTYWPARNSDDKETREAARRGILRAIVGIKDCKEAIKKITKAT